MKKKLIFFAIVLVVCVVGVFAFTACNLNNIKIEGEGKTDYSADTKKDCMPLLNGLFEDALKNPNVVVTTKQNGTTTGIEKVLGTKSCFEVPDSEGKTYAFIQDGKYYVAEAGELTYKTGKDKYDEKYCLFLYPIKTIDALAADSGTFACEYHGQDKGLITKDKQVSESSGTFSFTYTGSDVTYTITATLKNDLVETLTFSDGKNTTINYTFAYGSASVELPDISAWEDETEPNEGTGDVA